MSRVMRNKQDYLFYKLFSCASNRRKPRDLFVFPCSTTGTSSDSSGPTAQVSMERGWRRKWQEVLFRPPQREGRASSRAHRETQGTSTGSATQKTLASTGFLPSAERISAAVSKSSTGEEFQCHDDESLTFAVYERTIFYTTVESCKGAYDPSIHPLNR